MEVGPLARLVVGNKYPLGSNLLAAGYNAIYVETGGLNLNVISADLANALIKDGLVSATAGQPPLAARTR